ncbi:Isopentenyl-diphosphate Delta-isomerase 1 [Astathelohania contejeani]|uniref:isopentenyl-diphosphate Delta-isomerase n=1 Tax=Astathelohania contejeani TaxID=164912 RepID=A0ABQ7HZI2_9MICR|nr:Isopentenyl-diphosphate Delta-isomerase 1 [Thelohania contejeani]
MDNFKKKLIIVNEKDEIIGTKMAWNGHLLPKPILHRAFSVFAFDKNNRLLIQKRAKEKRVFPGLWANTCCSHPFINPRSFIDPIGDAKSHAIARLEYEMGITGINESDLHFHGRILYKAIPNEEWGEQKGKDIPIQKYEDFNSENEILEEENGFGEYEMDYIFVLTKPVSPVPRKSEVEDWKYITKDELAKLNGIVPWVRIIMGMYDVFEMVNH